MEIEEHGTISVIAHVAKMLLQVLKQGICKRMKENVEQFGYRKGDRSENSCCRSTDTIHMIKFFNILNYNMYPFLVRLHI